MKNLLPSPSNTPQHIEVKSYGHILYLPPFGFWVEIPAIILEYVLDY